jgi:O-antigen ligase
LMLNLLLPLGVALLLSSRSTLARTALVVVVLLEAAAVIVTFSRAGFLSLATCVALYLWRLVRRGLTGWVLAAFLAGVAGMTLLPGSYMARLATITDIDSDPTGSAQSRWEDTRAAVRYVMANPIVGAGIGMDTEALNAVRGITWTQVHNICLEYAVDLGLPGLALFVLLFVSCVRRVRRIHRAPTDDPGGRLSCLAEGIEIALLSFGVGALFAPVAYLFYFYYLAGLAVAAGAIHRQLVAAGDGEPMASAS